MKVENIKFWSVKDWDNYLKDFAHKVADVQVFKHSWTLTISRWTRNDRNQTVMMTDIKVRLPLV